MDLIDIFYVSNVSNVERATNFYLLLYDMNSGTVLIGW